MVGTKKQPFLKQEACLPFEFGEHIGHHRATFDGFFCAVVVFEQSEHVSAVLHGQTTDQLLHHLTQGEKYQGESPALSL